MRFATKQKKGGQRHSSHAEGVRVAFQSAEAVKICEDNLRPIRPVGRGGGSSPTLHLRGG